MEINVQELISRAREIGISNTMHEDESLEAYGLGGVDCPICQNTGVVKQIIDTPGKLRELRCAECKCMNVRRNMRRIRSSGLSEMLDRYTLDSYIAEDEKRIRLLQKAKDFCQADEGWMYLSGTPGSGKTHICTAICGELIRKGVNVRYSLWRDDSTRLKACVNEREEYEELIRPLKDVAVLYIDDFLKAKTVTDADLNLAFELLNFRYNDKRKRTIISSEKSLSDIMNLDSALGSRIYERAAGFRLSAPNENYRLRR